MPDQQPLKNHWAQCINGWQTKKLSRLMSSHHEQIHAAIVMCWVHYWKDAKKYIYSLNKVSILCKSICWWVLPLGAAAFLPPFTRRERPWDCKLANFELGKRESEEFNWNICKKSLRKTCVGEPTFDNIFKALLHIWSASFKRLKCLYLCKWFS